MLDVKNIIKGLECCSVSSDKRDCDLCPIEFGEGCALKLKRDALALLKSQEPRIMSEVELREIQNETPVWIEIPFEGCDIGHWVLVSYNHYEYKGVKFSFDEGLLKGLGLKWRCWTSRPTEAEREDVKWK